MKVVMLDMYSYWECHKIDCVDAAKKLRMHPLASNGVQYHWVEESLEKAQANFERDMGEDAGYEDPYVWGKDCKVYPCAKEG